MLPFLVFWIPLDSKSTFFFPENASIRSGPFDDLSMMMNPAHLNTTLSQGENLRCTHHTHYFCGHCTRGILIFTPQNGS